MGGLRARLPWTYWTFVIGGLALAASSPSRASGAKTPSWARCWHRALPLAAIPGIWCSTVLDC